MKKKKNILFVCTGNSCRSQMAEGLAKNMGWNAFSAGTNPEKEVSPNAIIAMKEIGMDISEHYPKFIDEIKISEMDMIMTVCSSADKNCPVFSGFKGKKIHQSFDDPANADGSDDEKLMVFKRVRDEIFKFLNRNLK